MRRIVVGLGALAASLWAPPGYAQAAAPTVILEQRGEINGARLLAATATDPLRKRTLLFGGFTNGGIRNDTLEWDGVGWTKRTPSVLPPPRYAAGMVYEDRRQRVLLFGGVESNRGSSGFQVSDNRMWEWSGGDWRALSTLDTPPPRMGPAMVVDPHTGDVWMFGGGTENASLDDFYRFDGLRWNVIPKPASAAWPSPRALASFAFDPVSQALILFGGLDSFGVSSSGTPSAGTPKVDTWSWNGDTWTEVAAADHPVARPPVQVENQTIPLMGRSSLVTDKRRGVLILTQEAVEGVQVWRWDPSVPSWLLEHAPIDASSPNLRIFSTSFWDAARNDVHVVGGLRTYVPPGSTPIGLINAQGELFDGSMANEEWAYGGIDWHRWHAAGEPSARTGAAAAFHDALGVGVLFGGGFGSDTVLGDSWIWDGGRWYEGSEVDGSVGTRPEARMHHAIVYDPERNGGTLVLFGGANDSKTVLADTWLWRNGWTKLAAPPSGGPLARARHVLAKVPGGVMMYGGSVESAGSDVPDTWFLGSSATAWQALAGRTTETREMCAASLGDNAYLYGGALRGGGTLATIFQRFGVDRAFTPIALPADNPERRSNCSLVGDPRRGQLYLSGGRGPGEAKANWYLYDVAADLWSALDPRPYDALGERAGRMLDAASFYDPIGGAVTQYGGQRRDLETVVSSTWRLRTVGETCSSECAGGLTCVEGACCEASACGPCESCAMQGHRGVCTARGVVESAPGCSEPEGLACNVSGRCRAREGSTCNDDAQCASGSCAAGFCCPPEGCAERCIDERTQKNKDGSLTICGAYLCKGSGCLAGCSTVNDCNAGNVCSTDLQCVPAAELAASDSGCSCSVPHGRAPGASVAALVLVGLLRMRRRRY